MKEKGALTFQGVSVGSAFYFLDSPEECYIKRDEKTVIRAKEDDDLKGEVVGIKDSETVLKKSDFCRAIREI